jgi:multidrug efflux pump subunit AcrA (membrane-fusion protein)
MKPFDRLVGNLKPEFALFLLTAVFMSCHHAPKEADILASGAPVKVTHPKRIDLKETVDLNATTIFLSKEIVRATFQGFIQNITRNVGDEVKAGDLLFQIKTKESAADDSLAPSLGSPRFQGPVDFLARSNGVMTALYYHMGDFVSEGEEIAIISNPSSLCITLNVPYQYVSGIRVQDPCEIFLPDGKKLKAAIRRKIPSVDPVSQTQTFLLGLDGKPALPENLNVVARVALRTVKNALVLPLGAVLADETQKEFWIMKLINDTTAVREDITRGIENDTLVQIIAPELKMTDQIVSDGAYGLPDTAKVSLSR